jgi:hypothetical protein
MWMSFQISNILFDAQDHELVSMIQDVIKRDETRTRYKDLLNFYLHPRGIKELAAPSEMRIAYAMINLLTSLEIGKVEERIQALRALRDEVLFSAQSHFQKNTARVLMQIMKELVRSGGDYARQLELAHDFREAAVGKPRVVRKQLQNYHLLEMPEEWNQLAFDNHVHDVHTKGRKTPTHLIMDAWIKGIRQLTVIYYHYVSSEAAEELLEAADIMKISVRIGISLPAKFGNRYVRIIWAPRGFFSTDEFLSFLKQEAVASFMVEGKKVAEYQQQYILSVLDEFNQRHCPVIKESLDISFPALDRQEFLSFVGTGQLSLLHLGEFIQAKMLPSLKAKIEQLRSRYAEASSEERLKIKQFIEDIYFLDSEAIVERYLRPECNPGLPDPNIPAEGPNVPYTLKMTPAQVMNRLRQLQTGHRIILNLSGLTPEDIIELLYDCNGMITHIEIFNLKDQAAGKTNHLKEIIDLQKLINDGNVILMIRVMQRIILDWETSPSADSTRTAKFKEILRNVATLLDFYKNTPLKSNIGSDSAGRSHHQFGMGLVVTDTLPSNAKRTCNRKKHEHLWKPLPIRAVISRRTTESQEEGEAVISLRKHPYWLSWLLRWERRESVDWIIEDFKPAAEKGQNIVPLGGFHQEPLQEPLNGATTSSTLGGFRWSYFNSGLKNGLKVLIGFIPAFATFALTQDWWLLTYFGAFIWFGITGLRNIMQSVLGGGGIQRSPLLRWNDYVSWGRIADSLLFTGFSVPLLEYIVKTLIMNQMFGVTVSTNPILLYTMIALANGLYISSHNAFRGLPRGAILGNFFRTMLSIPLAVFFNALIGTTLVNSGFINAGEILQKWAAIISKTASDCVAGIIEGIADRYNNIRLRMQDYESKWKKLLDTTSRLELLFPENDILELLKSSGARFADASKVVQDLRKIMIIHALDLLYFRWYQPRARTALHQLFRKICPEERSILTISQQILQNEQEISRMFVDGMIGKNFARGLSFYLSYYRKYLWDINTLIQVNFGLHQEKAEHQSPYQCPTPDQMKADKLL